MLVFGKDDYLFVGIGLLVFFIPVWWLSGPQNASTASDNHDNLKVKHCSQTEANAEIRRTQRRGRYPGSDMLNLYYNNDTQGWYNGKSSRY
jgi:hypothetical protein